MTTPEHRITLAVPPQPADHSRGSLRAPVTVIEYGDFECPGCRSAAQTSTLLLERFPGEVRFIYRHFPMPEAHPHAVAAAEAAEAAGGQGKFWQMHDVLFQQQGHLRDADLQRHAAELGLDMARYVAERDDHIYLQRVREHQEGGHRSHLRATPTFFVDGVVRDVSYGLVALHDAVADAVGRAAR